jgi:8-oxo-dGTP pyrophosphatase MutT (NUDIX family)
MKVVERPSARVIAVDPDGGVLLFRVEDRLDDRPPIWITPGGGIETGESPAEAAAREFREETGIVVPVAALATPVAVTRGEWVFRGRRLYSVDWFFAWRGQRFEPSKAEWSALEHELHAEARWWTADELDRTADAVLPAELGWLVRAIAAGDVPDAPIELPWLAFD